MNKKVQPFRAKLRILDQEGLAYLLELIKAKTELQIEANQADYSDDIDEINNKISEINEKIEELEENVQQPITKEQLVALLEVATNSDIDNLFEE